LQSVGFVQRNGNPQEFVLIIFPFYFPHVTPVVSKSAVVVSCNFHSRNPSVSVRKVACWQGPSTHVKIAVFFHRQFYPPLVSDAQNQFLLRQRGYGRHI